MRPRTFACVVVALALAVYVLLTLGVWAGWSEVGL